MTQCHIVMYNTAWCKVPSAHSDMVQKQIAI